MHPDIAICDCVLKGEEIEQMINEIIKTLAQYELNYDASKYVLNLAIDEIGRKYFFKA
ncbi:hypothetical protein [Lutispora sp.]|uniref:hypothetical protein n=1 Tax=Lutispora sp. TaxID=2828727 RepID=UPI002B2132DA|nr:hypothetical protein [Lutispora sp.]MEA4962099.1 hypothetical protein [Lutispora sp.]